MEVEVSDRADNVVVEVVGFIVDMVVVVVVVVVVDEKVLVDVAVSSTITAGSFL